MRRLIVLILLLLASPGSAAEPDANSRIPAPKTATPPKPEAKPGEWQLVVGAATAEGRRTISATLPADASIPGSFGPVTPKLVLRYRGGQPAAYVAFETYLGEGELDVVVTFGDEPAEAQKWTISADGQAAFAAGDALAFFERLKPVKTLAVKAAPRKKVPVTVTFSPHETDAVLKALISAGVKYGG